MTQSSATVLRFNRRRAPIKLPDEILAVPGALDIDFDCVETKFMLHRSKMDGVRIMFKSGRLTWNATHYLGVRFDSFVEARKWVAAFACAHGQEITEVTVRGSVF